MPSLCIYVYWNRKIKGLCSALIARKSKKTLGWVIEDKIYNGENYIARVMRNPQQTMNLRRCKSAKEAELLIEKFYGVRV